jgi:hypothetical protein
MQTRMRSPAAQGPAIALACMCVSNCSSTRSAVRRSASSRSAVRLPGREIMLERALGLLGDVDLALLQPLDQVVGVRSISSIASARSNTESGTVSRTRTWRDLGDRRR